MYKNGDMFEGNLNKYDKKSGFGVMKYDNGDKFVGYWENDIRGEGTLSDKEGNILN